ncbi:hypothetical protein F4680DRAFT_422974 [Xylaria scruposa]|nr:hypothetical protein F4680DRAFT_422974 [Xylaria scruposa]
MSRCGRAILFLASPFTPSRSCSIGGGAFTGERLRPRGHRREVDIGRTIHSLVQFLVDTAIRGAPCKTNTSYERLYYLS